MEIVKLNNKIINDKPTMLFYIHLGFGDLLNMSGAIRYLSKNYKLTVTTLPNNKKNALILFNDIEDISFLLTDKFYKMFPNDFEEINKNYAKVLMTGVHDKNYLISKIPYTFYSHINLDYNDHGKNLFLKKSIINENYEKIKNMEFIFVHTLSSTNDFDIELEIDSKCVYTDSVPCSVGSKLIICCNKNYYDKNHEFYHLAELFVNLPFFEYTEIIENACEIHVIDSSFFCYCLYLNLKTDKKFCYFRFNSLQYIDNTWRYIYQQQSEITSDKVKWVISPDKIKFK